ncbi:hypothetical protein CR513_41589, partial [Mucuna pruriens]
MDTSVLIPMKESVLKDFLFNESKFPFFVPKSSSIPSIQLVPLHLIPLLQHHVLHPSHPMETTSKVCILKPQINPTLLIPIGNRLCDLNLMLLLLTKLGLWFIYLLEDLHQRKPQWFVPYMNIKLGQIFS